MLTYTFSFPQPFKYAQGMPASAVVAQSVPAVVPEVSVASTSLLFLGDVMLGRAVETISKNEGWQYPFAGFETVLRTYHPTYVIANLEGSAPRQHVQTKNFTMQFSFASQALTALAKFGVTHVGLANNHSYDFGVTGYEDTKAQLASVGIVPFGDTTVGSSSVSFLLTDAGVVALVGVYAVDATPDLAALKTELEELVPDHVICFVHWGVEYQTTHTRAMETLATELVALGADVIIGHHPHVVGDIEYIHGVPVFYSLGNFIFDQYFSPEVQTGLSVLVQYEGAEQTITLLPYESLTHKSQPQLLAGDKKAAFLESIAQHSDPLLAPYIVAGVIPQTVEIVANLE